MALYGSEQALKREQFRADFVLTAISVNPFPVTIDSILAAAKEAEALVFGPLPEEGK